MGYYWSGNNLQEGSQGKDVSSLQTFLKEQGYYTGAIDGDFGPKTKEALVKYQGANGIGVDGIFGPTTAAKAGFKNYNVKIESTPFEYEKYTPTIESTPFEYEKYTPDPFTKSDDLIAAEGQSKAAEDAVANYGDFSWDKQGDYDAMYKKYTERGPFSYDFNADALYQQYKDKYMQQGKMVSADVMGQAAAMTGGYGNSYAASVGNQAYQQSLQQVNDVIPELYQLAYSKYQQEGQDMLNALGLLEGDRAFDYGMYTDKYGRLVSDRGYYGDKANNLYGREYGEHMDAIGIEQSEHQTEQGYEYQTGRDYVEDQQWLAGIEQSEHQAAQGYEYQAGRDSVDDQQWQATFDEGIRQFEETQNATTAGGSDSGPKYDNGGYDDATVKAAQEFIGVSADGQWGPKSAAAAKEAGYNSIAEVVAAMGGGGPVEDYSDWDAGTWEGYFANIRNRKGGSVAEAEAELNRMIAAGLIPTNMIVYASLGARGRLGH